MPTNEERREVAARLHESREFISGMPKMSLEQNAFDAFERILACVGYERGNIFDHLADLIEPEHERTCHVKQAYFHDCSDLDNLMEGIAFSPEDTVACICDSCGMNWRYDRGIRPKYCPNCGAKVIGG